MEAEAAVAALMRKGRELVPPAGIDVLEALTEEGGLAAGGTTAGSTPAPAQPAVQVSGVGAGAGGLGVGVTLAENGVRQPGNAEEELQSLVVQVGGPELYVSISLFTRVYACLCAAVLVRRVGPACSLCVHELTCAPNATRAAAGPKPVQVIQKRATPSSCTACTACTAGHRAWHAVRCGGQGAVAGAQRGGSSMEHLPAHHAPAQVGVGALPAHPPPIPTVISCSSVREAAPSRKRWVQPLERNNRR